MAKGEAAWTVLVYMAGDNNLTEEMVWGLQELKKAAARLQDDAKTKGRFNVVAHFDPRGSRSRRYDFVPSVRKLVAAGPETAKGTSLVGKEAAAIEADTANDDGNLEDYQAQIHTRKSAPNPPETQPESSQQADGKSADAAADPSLSNPLAAFVSDQVKNLPHAQNYFLILSGHGSGAVGDFLIDSDPVTSLSIPKLARILKAARTEYKKRTNEKKRIDILGMDSCLMSNAEVCCEVSDEADFLVASEGWVANAGWPYHRVLEACRKENGTADTDPRSVADRVAKTYSDFYRDYEISEMSTDIAVCKLEAFRPDSTLLQLIRALSTELVEAFDTVFVSQELSRIAKEPVDATKLLAEVRREIDSALGLVETGTANLSKGIADAGSWLDEPLAEKKLTDSQWRAFRDLMVWSKLSKAVDDDQMEEKNVTQRKEVLDLFDEPPSASAALASVRLRREFDPYVVNALERIEKVPSDVKNEARNRQLGAMRARVNLQKLHQILSALELQGLVERKGLARSLSYEATRPERELLNAVVAARWEAQSFKGGVYVDLADFCRCLEARVRDGDVKTLCGQVRQAIEGTTDGKLNGCAFGARQTGPANQHASGLSVYFPYQAGDYTTEYENLAFAKKTGWERLIRSYLRATRRERKGEPTHWKKPQDYVRRFGHSEVDPLEPDGIEARIVGVITFPTAGSDGKRAPGKAGGEGKIKAGGEGKIKAGGEGKIRAGGESKIRAGSEAKIRGEGVQFVWGNPPDGFFRQGAKK
jgi:cysteine peptidase C11 family protein